MNYDFPGGPPGVHPPTAALTKILRFNGVMNPISDQPYSEAMLLGIGGGIDIGYILFRFPHLTHPMLVLGFRNQWNDARVFLSDLTTRLNLFVKFLEFNDQEEAEKALQNTIKHGKQTIIWVDKAHLPYHFLADNLEGLINYQMAVYARDEHLGTLFIDDLSVKPIQIEEKVIASARESLTHNDFLMMVFDRAGNLNANDLREAIIDGIRASAIRLRRPMKTIGISNLETWAQRLTDRKDRQGWPQVFKDHHDLYYALRTVYESIKLNGTDGFALRRLYANFLHEAAGALDNPALNAISGQYLQLSNHWSNLAENALPSKIPDFDRVKNLLNKKQESFHKQDVQSSEDVINDLQVLERKITSNFPLNNQEVNQLYDRLSSQIKLIAELEINAAQRLGDVTGR
jgi:hypothetical protein